MAININFSGLTIKKPGYYGCPWWDKIQRELKRERKLNDEQITAFLCLTDTLIRLDLYPEHIWKGRNVK